MQCFPLCTILASPPGSYKDEELKESILLTWEAQEISLLNTLFGRSWSTIFKKSTNVQEYDLSGVYYQPLRLPSQQYLIYCSGVQVFCFWLI